MSVIKTEFTVVFPSHTEGRIDRLTDTGNAEITIRNTEAHWQNRAFKIIVLEANDPKDLEALDASNG